jgi:DNA-binding NtrC family response regulator
VLGEQVGDVDVANTSACALEYADEKEYDVAIIDESLEKTRGQELFEQIRDCQTAVKGILCSEQPTIDTVEAAVDSGMESVVQKPIDQSEILELVSS